MVSRWQSGEVGGPLRSREAARQSGCKHCLLTSSLHEACMEDSPRRVELGLSSMYVQAVAVALLHSCLGSGPGIRGARGRHRGQAPLTGCAIGTRREWPPCRGALLGGL